MTSRSSLFPTRQTVTAIGMVAALLAGCSVNSGSKDTAPVGAVTFTNSDSALTSPHNASVYGNFLAGLYANKQQDLDAAADFMAEALAQDPKNPALLRQTFLLSASTGDMDRAVALARRIAQTPADHNAATVLRILHNAKSGSLDRARELLSEMPKRGLGQLLHPLLGSWLALAEGNVPDNVAKLRGLDAIEGVDILRQVHSALIHDLSGRAEKAAEEFDAATADTENLSLRLAWLAANFYKRHGETAKADQLLTDLVAANPDSTTAKAIQTRVAAEAQPERLIRNAPEGMAEALFNIAGLLNQQGASDIALLYARLSLYLHPNFDFGQMLLGEILEDQGRTKAAINAYRAVPADSPFAYAARLRVASGLQDLGKPDAAIALLEDIAATASDRYEPLYRLGNIQRGEERFAAAADAYQRALDRIGETEQRHWSLHYFLGIALERLDRWAEAETQFKRALELQPEQPYVMNYLAYSWVEQKINLEEAQKMLQRAVSQRPEDGFIVDSMGWVYYRLGRYGKAVEYLERAVELRPDDPVINDHLGDAYWKAGRRQEARFQWHRALTLDPEQDVATQIEVKLKDGLNSAKQPNG